jgi:ATP synthase protein I
MVEFRKSDANMMRTAWELSAALLSFVVALGLGYWIGLTLDRWIGSAPWMMVLFAGFGFIAGLLNVYRTVSGAIRRPGSPGSGGPGGIDVDGRGRQ